MGRLIDADAIEHCLVIGGRRHGKTIISEIIWRAIQTAPTVDAVPVIRCKDCKKFVVEEDQAYCLDMYGQCDENGFCAWAERKEE